MHARSDAGQGAGEVILRTVVSQQGEPTNIRIIKPLEDSLGREAVKALAKWVFEPVAATAIRCVSSLR